MSYKVEHHFTSIEHPQANVQVKVACSCYFSALDYARRARPRNLLAKSPYDSKCQKITPRKEIYSLDMGSQVTKRKHSAEIKCIVTKSTSKE